MPKVHEETLTIRVYKLLKKDQESNTIVSEDVIDALYDVIENLLDDRGIVIEVEKQ
jgi:hypothetical protein